MSHTICFKESGEFVEVSPSCLDVVTSTGTYHIDKDTIILNTTLQPEDFLKVRKWKDATLDSFYIKVKALSGDSTFLYTVLFINDSTIYNLDNQNIAEVLAFPTGSVQKINIFYQYNTPWQIKEIDIFPEKNNVIELTVDDTRNYALYFFRNRKLLYNKNHLRDLQTGYDYHLNTSCKCISEMQGDRN